ncbi:MAG: hypothetical protein LBG58_15235 [Planctomycetaceae bacterium]|nr:hypothetical protein [Planctomycetaceae bacterium]
MGCPFRALMACYRYPPRCGGLACVALSGRKIGYWLTTSNGSGENIARKQKTHPIRYYVKDLSDSVNASIV